jgi:hypothetical protein
MLLAFFARVNLSRTLPAELSVLLLNNARLSVYEEVRRLLVKCSSNVQVSFCVQAACSWHHSA